MPAAKKSSSERRTVGVFAAQLTRAWGAEFMTGLMDAAEEQDLNVVCFVGGKPVKLQTPDQSQPSYGLYDLFRPGQFDGLLLCADLALGSTRQQLQEFCRRLAPT